MSVCQRTYLYWFELQGRQTFVGKLVKELLKPRKPALLTRASAFKNMLNSTLRREVLDFGESCEVKRLSCNEYRTVNINKRTCSCKQWQEKQHPCVHGYAVILARRHDIAEYVHSVYRAATSVRISPIDVATCVSDRATSATPRFEYKEEAHCEQG
ncbi:hypothetical protein AaE_006946 [Aphanomyces astaci]|uniref:SWIM-type domain-containing protein n=1 Tax=Aphanomyces astaci TaxID=112090 RepID=A0A6A5ABY3_APHAT|nr:hypothetical protein AaE_006946 [Aphanomyces astaci]